MNKVILLHGALGAQTQLEPLKKILEQSGHEVYTLNFSGHGGESFQSTFGIETFAEDVIRFMNHVKIAKADVFGYSMGGYVAVWLAYIFPERIGRIVTLGTKFDWSSESAKKEVKKVNADKILEKVQAFARILEHRHAPNDWRDLINKTSDMMLALGDSPLLTESNLKTIRHEIEICLGDSDDMADRDFSIQVSQWLPSATYHELKDTPHPIEKVDLLNLIQFINTDQ